jgi:hypothetical protein
MPAVEYEEKLLTLRAQLEKAQAMDRLGRINEHGERLVPSTALRYSHSKGSTFEDCHRKGWYAFVAELKVKEAAHFRIGKGVHAVNEHLLTTGEWPDDPSTWPVPAELSPAPNEEIAFWRDIAAPGRETLTPLVQHPGLHIESHLSAELLKEPNKVMDFKGFIDAGIADPAVAGSVHPLSYVAPWVQDHKSRGTLNPRYLPTPAELASNRQMLGYVPPFLFVACGMDPDNPPEQVAVTHWNYQTRDGFAFKAVHGIAPWENVERNWLEIRGVASLMHDLAGERDPDKVPANTGACGKYASRRTGSKGCEYREICSQSPENRTRSTLGLLRQIGQDPADPRSTPMPTAAELLAAKRQARRKTSNPTATATARAKPEPTPQKPTPQKPKLAVVKTDTTDSIQPPDRAPEATATPSLVQAVADTLSAVAAAIPVTLTMAMETAKREGLDPTPQNLAAVAAVGGFKITGLVVPNAEIVKEVVKEVAEEVAEEVVVEVDGVVEVLADEVAVAVDAAAAALRWGRLDHLVDRGLTREAAHKIDALAHKLPHEGALVAGIVKHLLVENGKRGRGYQAVASGKDEANGIWANWRWAEDKKPEGWSEYRRLHSKALRTILNKVPGVVGVGDGKGREQMMWLESTAFVATEPEATTTPATTEPEATTTPATTEPEATTTPATTEPEATTTPATTEPEATTPARMAVVAAKAACAADPENEKLRAAFREAVRVAASTPGAEATPGELVHCALMAQTGGLFINTPAVHAWNEVMAQAHNAAANGFIDAATVKSIDRLAPQVVVTPWSELPDGVKATIEAATPDLVAVFSEGIEGAIEEAYAKGKVDGLNENIEKYTTKDLVKDGMAVEIKKPQVLPLMVFMDCYPRGFAGVRHLSEVTKPYVAEVMRDERMEDGSKISEGGLFMLPYRRGQLMLQSYLRMAIERLGTRAILGDAVVLDRGHPMASEFLSLVGELSDTVVVR